MSDFKAKLHEILFPLGLCPRPRWGNLQRSPRPSSCTYGRLLLRGRRGYMEGTWRERKWEGKGKGERKGGEDEGEGRGRDLPDQCQTAYHAPVCHLKPCEMFYRCSTNAIGKPCNNQMTFKVIQWHRKWRFNGPYDTSVVCINNVSIFHHFWHTTAFTVYCTWPPWEVFQFWQTVGRH